MDIKHIITKGIVSGLKHTYGLDVAESSISLQPTKKEFEGTWTFVTFPLTKDLRKKPEEIGDALGKYLAEHIDIVSGFNVVKGFLNVGIKDAAWLGVLAQMMQDAQFGKLPKTGQRVMVEYSSPNTNKPLHLGHLRNNFLGFSVANILEAAGYDVVKTILVNDRGIHICKSMLAYKRFGNEETPKSSGIKGDHLVGKYYVAFDKALQAEIKPLMDIVLAGDISMFQGHAKTEIQKLLEKFAQTSAEPDKQADVKADIKQLVQNQAPLMKEAQAMLLKWEANDPETRALWQLMNGWVLSGFDESYTTMGVSFDKYYYESNTYVLGKDIVDEGLQKGVFFKKPDGSVWIDLTADKKTV